MGFSKIDSLNYNIIKSTVLDKLIIFDFYENFYEVY
jgi:hypothetical protein